MQQRMGALAEEGLVSWFPEETPGFIHVPVTAIDGLREEEPNDL